MKKNSDRHTSIQWSADPARSCPEFAAAASAGRRSAQVLGCPCLARSVVAAAAAGEVAVPRD